MPSYAGLGFEVRNQHEQRGMNEEYTKLYVFRIEDDRQPDKVTHGPFKWGQNADQFMAISRMRQFAESIWPNIVGKETQWIVAPHRDVGPPQPPGGPARSSKKSTGSYIVWTHTQPTGEPVPNYVFAASMTGELPKKIAGIKGGEVVFEESGCRVWRVEPA